MKRNLDKRIKQVKEKMPMVFYLSVFIFVINGFTSSILFVIYLRLAKGEIRFEQDLAWFVLIILVASIVVSTFIVRGLGNRIIFRSIRQIIDASKAVAEGDFSQRLEEPREKEVAEICKSFNEMVDRLGNNELLARDFISNVSHQFKTPLASIHGFAQLLESEDLSDAEKQEYVSVIKDKSIAMSDMINDILELSRLEHLNYDIKKATFSLDEQIQKCILLYDDELKEKGLEVELQIKATDCYGNVELLAEVWKNLIENAIKFSQENGVIKIITESGFDYVLVTVQDDGIGMSLDTQMHIFDRFFRGKEAQTYKGTGLGLSIVKSIVDKHDGEIKIYSELREGSKFVVKLPF